MILGASSVVLYCCINGVIVVVLWFSNVMPEFRDFINQLALVDLLLRGGDFTWSRSWADSVAFRLDRFLFQLIGRSFFQI